jgi:hypothetical protein
MAIKKQVEIGDLFNALIHGNSRQAHQFARSHQGRTVARQRAQGG